MDMITKSMAAHHKSILKREELDETTYNGTMSTSSGEVFGDDEAKENKTAPLHVKFVSIQIRDYSITLGDNPSCSSYGPPISLDWEYIENEAVSLDRYEKMRPSRRKMYQMHILSRHRADLLRYVAGTTDDEMQVVMREMREIQKMRSKTKASLLFSKVEEAAESAAHKWNRRKFGNAKEEL
mmetsp:Transcript_21681/g.25037  ORF Transcript_21681/g.25037 Transcript_21681/m.25037 type:complete len:182 (+) Transcript_21681:172-717(+)